MENKRILITGGAGSVGSELVRQLALDNKIFILDTNETDTFGLREEMKAEGHWVHSRTGDIRNKDTLFDVFSDFKPEIVFHAAALKHVTPNEEYPEEAVYTNIIGTLNLIKEARRWECLEKFVLVSTDKVVNARCIMGITKLCAEGLVRAQGAGFIVVRFGNVMGSRGSVIPIWQKAMDKGKPLPITDPRMTRYMMTIQEAAGLVIKAGEDGKGGEIFILNMGRKVNILQLAEDILRESDSEAGVEVIGKRPGEQLTEKLMFDEEKKVAEIVGKFYVIR